MNSYQNEKLLWAKTKGAPQFYGPSCSQGEGISRIPSDPQRGKERIAFVEHC